VFKVVQFIIEAILWLLLFLSPALFFGVIALLFYINDWENGTIPVVLIVAGVISGVIFAEYIRRKHGCSAYLSRIFSTPDIKD